MLEICYALCLPKHLLAYKHWDFDDCCQKDRKQDGGEDCAEGQIDYREGGQLEIVLPVVDKEESDDEMSCVDRDAQFGDEVANPAFQHFFQGGVIPEQRRNDDHAYQQRHNDVQDLKVENMKIRQIYISQQVKHEDDYSQA